jgi:hypothetical protein
MLLLSGRANTRCSVCRFDPGGLSSATPAGARNGFGEPRDREPKSRLSRPRSAAETVHPVREPAETPAKCALFVRDQETPVRIGMRGGAGRTRTACQARSPVEPVSDVVTAQFAGLELSLASRRLGECDQLTTSLPPLLGLRLSHTGEICLRPVEARHESDTWGQRASAFGTTRSCACQAHTTRGRSPGAPAG